MTCGGKPRLGPPCSISARALTRPQQHSADGTAPHSNGHSAGRSTRLHDPAARAIALVRMSASGAACLAVPGAFVEKPRSPLGLVDPNLEQARGRDVAMLVAQQVRFT